MLVKNVEKSREVRLWITQIVAPVLIISVIIAQNPQVQDWFTTKVNNIKQKHNKRKMEKKLQKEGKNIYRMYID